MNLLILTLVANLLISLFVGLLVNWLADRLPGYGLGALHSSRLQLSIGGTSRRWVAVILFSALFGFYLAWLWQSPVGGTASQRWLVWFCFALFLLILVIDLEHRRVLNVVVYPMACVALALVFVRGDLSLFSAISGGLAGFALFFLLFLLRPGGLGAGDVKLAGLIGLLVGFPGVLVALVSAIGLGGVGAGFLLLFRRVDLRGTMAYAPYLSVGALIALLYGSPIVKWYLGHFGL